MRRPTVRKFFLGLIPAFFCLAGTAWGDPPTLRIPRVTRPPRLEDFLNGISREAEVRVTDFRQREPGDGTPASQETAAYLSYDENNLYVVFACKDQPEKIRARLGKREDISADDAVAVYLDTFHDRRRAYLFSTNPLGIQMDGVFTEGQYDDLSFDTLWHSEGRLTPDGFIVLMAIPFKSLRFPRAASQTWGIALGRKIPRVNEESWWPYITNRVEGFVQQMATLEGLVQISPGRNLQFIPYGAFNRARYLDEDASAFRKATEGRAGLDAKIVLRDALSLDIALNPDFSQVESDDPQVTINQRFEVFFPEKRPFFIENSGFFQTPIQLFFSRRILDPEFGARLTGKAGPWSLGALAIDDRAPGQKLPLTDADHGRRAGIGVLRVQREFAGQSSVGVLVTSRDFASTSNRVFAIDSRLKLNPNWVLIGQASGSTTREKDGSRLSGPAYSAELQHQGRNFFYRGIYSDFSPSFRSQPGFVRRVDIRQMEHFSFYNWRPKSSRVIRFGPQVFTSYNWDHKGRFQDWVLGASFLFELPGRTLFGAGGYSAYELFEQVGFRPDGTGFFFVSEWLRWLQILASYTHGTAVNYFPGRGLAPFLADSSQGDLELTLRPIPRLRLDKIYRFNSLHTRKGTTPAGLPVFASIFNNHLLRSKVNYQFTRRLSLRAILDYNAALPNAFLVDLERDKRFTRDVLLTYLVNPGTALYVGYTDRYENLAVDTDDLTGVRRTPAPTTATGRQFFIKLSYLFRF